MQKECLTNELQHIYEFVDYHGGRVTWMCKLCGRLEHEYEDSQP